MFGTDSIKDATIDKLKEAGILHEAMPEDIFYVKGPMGKGL